MSADHKVKISGALPVCDVHRFNEQTHVNAVYDARTKFGPWAFLCEDCFQSLGVGLGTGLGHRLVLVGAHAE